MAKKIKRYKVGLDSETYKISMVTEPAIEVDYVALEKDKDEMQMKFSSDERHICYGPALIPNRDIYRNNGQQEFYINFTEESIVKMSQEFMYNYKQHEVNLQHDKNADEVFVCESWLVEDPYKDKANALGFNVPKNTWMIAMKVNNIEVWDKVKNGELKGFSVESAIHLEDFEKQNDNNMNIEDNEMFFDKLKNVFKEVLASVTMSKQEEDIEPISIEDMAEQTPSEPTVEAPAEPQPTEAPKAEEPVVEEPKVEEPKSQEEQVVEEPKPQETPNDNHLEDLIKSLKDEVEALKKMNSSLNSKVKELSKQPSAKPISVQGGNNNSNSYSQWRETMRGMIG